jgi:hypothetical protein
VEWRTFAGAQSRADTASGACFSKSQFDSLLAKSLKAGFGSFGQTKWVANVSYNARQLRSEARGAHFEGIAEVQVNVVSTMRPEASWKFCYPVAKP